jgi:hypothetical protein
MLEVVSAAGIAPANEEVDSPGYSQATELDPAALDAVQGGIAVPTGGTVRTTESQYTWFGMTYTQQHRTAYDADGNVVGTELYRPGSVWSDTTTTNGSGTRTTYDTGGNGLAAQFSTQHDPDGRFTGAGFDARANVTVGDFNLTGNLRGNVELGRDQDGNLRSGAIGAHADAGIAHEPTGLGVRLSGDASLAGNVVRDSEGNIMGAGVRVDAQAPLDLTYQGDRVVGVNLLGVHGDAQGRVNEDGGFDGSVAGNFTRLGTSIGADGCVHTDGNNTLFGANADYQRQLLGPYGAQARTSSGFDASLGDNPELNARFDAQANLFGHEMAGTSLSATLDRDGLRAEGDFRHIDPPSIPDVVLPNLPDIPLPPLPSISLPDHLPEVTANPTGLPGTNGNSEPTTDTSFQPTPVADETPAPEPDPTPAPAEEEPQAAE